MEASPSSRSSSDETEYDFKLDNCTTSSAQKTAARSENEPSRLDQENAQCKIEVAVDDNVIARKLSECGLGDVRVPELRLPRCSETESDDSDDDLCSASDDDSDEPYNPLASGVMPPVLPDIQLRVPMKDASDARRVKDALLIKGVLDVVCDEERQVVTVTGVVPPYRLLKKVRQVKPQARIISTGSPYAMFVNPSLRPSAHIDERESAAPIDIPTPHPVPHFVVRQQRPRPTFQQYTFHNDPHSPYLRTFSPSNLSPEDASHHHNRLYSSFYDDDLYQGNGFIWT